MKVSFDVEAKNFKGDLLVLSENGITHTVNIADELSKMLFFEQMLDKSIDEKYKAYKLLMKLQKADSDFSAEELSDIKNIAAKSLVVGLFGQVVDIIEGS